MCSPPCHPERIRKTATLILQVHPHPPRPHKNEVLLQRSIHYSVWKRSGILKPATLKKNAIASNEEEKGCDLQFRLQDLLLCFPDLDVTRRLRFSYMIAEVAMRRGRWWRVIIYTCGREPSTIPAPSSFSPQQAIVMGESKSGDIFESLQLNMIRGKPERIAYACILEPLTYW